jgi:hypothetical protein
MAKSKLKRLQEALAAGDVEAAKALAGELAPKKAPRKPAKASPKARTTKKATARKKAAAAKPGPSPEEGGSPAPVPRPSKRASNDQDEGVGVIFRDDAENVMAGGVSRRTPDGEKSYARRQSLAGAEFRPEIVADEVELPASHAKLDKKLRRAKATPRPGQPGADRGPVEMVDIRCDGCGQMDRIVDGVFERIDDETKYKCNQCSCRGR